MSLNFLLTLGCANLTSTPIHYIAYEKNPVSPDSIGDLVARTDATNLGCPVDQLNEFLVQYRSRIEHWVENSHEENTQCRQVHPSLIRVGPMELELRIADVANSTLRQNSADIIYLDAFSPDANPECWTPRFLQTLYTALAAGGVLVTYCVKGTVQRALKQAGFQIQKLPGPPGKRECLRALKLPDSPDSGPDSGTPKNLTPG